MLVAGGIGAGAGAVTAKLVDIGVTDEFVAQLREMVRPGTTTVAVLADHVDAEAVLAELHRFEGARYVAGNLPLEAIQAVRDALGDPAATTSDADASHRRRRTDRRTVRRTGPIGPTLRTGRSCRPLTGSRSSGGARTREVSHARCVEIGAGGRRRRGHRVRRPRRQRHGQGHRSGSCPPRRRRAATGGPKPTAGEALVVDT